jgi:hypothetical protein
MDRHAGEVSTIRATPTNGGGVAKFGHTPQCGTLTPKRIFLASLFRQRPVVRPLRVSEVRTGIHRASRSNHHLALVRKGNDKLWLHDPINKLLLDLFHLGPGCAHRLVVPAHQVKSILLSAHVKRRRMLVSAHTPRYRINCQLVAPLQPMVLAQMVSA